METINKNKMIALFMGGLTSDVSNVVTGYQNIWLPKHGICRWDTVEIGKGKILRYHESWDWLMPVIDRIYSNDAYVKYKYVTSGQFENEIFINPKFIENTYNDVVEFIQWYNKNN